MPKPSLDGPQGGTLSTDDGLQRERRRRAEPTSGAHTEGILFLANCEVMKLKLGYGDLAAMYVIRCDAGIRREDMYS